MPVTNEQRARALKLSASIGTTHGMIDAGRFLSYKRTTDEVVLAWYKALDGAKEWDVNTTSPEDRIYPPNDIALKSGMMGADSPYGEYLDLCEAHDTAYRVAFVEVVRERATHIMARRRSGKDA